MIGAVSGVPVFLAAGVTDKACVNSRLPLWSLRDCEVVCLREVVWTILRQRRNEQRGLHQILCGLSCVRSCKTSIGHYKLVYGEAFGPN